MIRAEAHEALQSAEQHTRLMGARFFQLAATADDLPFLSACLRREENSWIRKALRDAILVATEGEAQDAEPLQDFEDEEYPAGVYRKALGDATRLLVHEIRPWIGRLRVSAELEVHEPKTSRLWSQLERLSELVDVIDLLRQATAVPSLEEFELASWIHTIADEELQRSEVDVEFAGRDPLIVIGDKRLLGMVFANALRNAAESTSDATESVHPPAVLITWGDTDRDYWVAVSDRGPGPPPGAQNAFKQGVSNKNGHFGMGLAIARAAIESMSGQIDLLQRARTEGATLEFRWPRSHQR